MFIFLCYMCLFRFCYHISVLLVCFSILFLLFEFPLSCICQPFVLLIFVSFNVLFCCLFLYISSFCLHTCLILHFRFPFVFLFTSCIFFFVSTVLCLSLWDFCLSDCINVFMPFIIFVFLVFVYIVSISFVLLSL